MNEEKAQSRMVSYAEAMAFAKDVVHADLCGDRCMCDADDREFAKASADWRAPQDGDEGYCECGDCDRSYASEVPAEAAKCKVHYSEATAPDYEASEYIEIKFYLTVEEVQDWIGLKLPPWWAATCVEQHLRKARTQP